MVTKKQRSYFLRSSPMSDSSSSTSAPIRLLIRLALTILMVWALPVLMPKFVMIQGGIPAIALIGVTLTLLNVIARPVINVVMLPFKLFVSLFAIVIANALFLWLLTWLVGMMDQTVVRFAIEGGWTGWVIVSLVLGIGNWLMKEILK
jgi:uncharacterized membrane protein YvlD (DUF360 family)